MSEFTRSWPGVRQGSCDLGLRDGAAVGQDPRGGVVVGVIELLPVPAVGKGRQDNVARGGAVHLGVGPAVHVGRGQAAEPGEGVVPPGAVVHGAGHRVPVLAVVGDVDAKILLQLDDVPHRGFQQVQELGRQAVGFLGLVRGDQLGRARQGAGVGDPDMVGVLGSCASADIGVSFPSVLAVAPVPVTLPAGVAGCVRQGCCGVNGPGPSAARDGHSRLIPTPGLPASRARYVSKKSPLGDARVHARTQTDAGHRFRLNLGGKSPGTLALGRNTAVDSGHSHERR